MGKNSKVDEPEEQYDWMNRILSSISFLKLSPTNIQQVFLHMEEISAKAGEHIIKQGGDAKYFYFIKHGKCKVTKKAKTGKELTIAKLSDGDYFGEDALLSKRKRNANVVMLTDCTLMRLLEKDFNHFLKDPVLKFLTYKEAKELVRNEKIIWIDLRSEDKYKKNGIKNSINIPLYELRLKASSLAPSKKYILYCDDGSLSSTGAFILINIGLEVYCLKGGLAAQI